MTQVVLQEYPLCYSHCTKPVNTNAGSFLSTYFLFLDRVRCLAQCFRLKLFKLLLSLIHDYSLFVDPGSLSNTTEELDMVLSVTYTQTHTHKKRTTLCHYRHHYFIHILNSSSMSVFIPLVFIRVWTFICGSEETMQGHHG